MVVTIFQAKAIVSTVNHKSSSSRPSPSLNFTKESHKILARRHAVNKSSASRLSPSLNFTKERHKILNCRNAV